ncbi:MAG: hypothetical protein P8Y53_20600 [Pseudolabrys sp.]|jgi:hypothetical protein
MRMRFVVALLAAMVIAPGAAMAQNALYGAIGGAVLGAAVGGPAGAAAGAALGVTLGGSTEPPEPASKYVEARPAPPPPSPPVVIAGKPDSHPAAPPG